MERIQFNTGRWYTEHGQRIIAVKHDNIIYFNDIDRGIDGQFDASDDDFGPVELSKTVVMSRYDNNSYGWIKQVPKEVERELNIWIEKTQLHGDARAES